MKKSGLLFHAKHAYMPNTLGYCGPDENGTILEHLEGGKEGDKLERALQGFEAAYPFLRLIARNSGKEVFDYSVPEAYWIGNGLLELVPPDDFLKFSKSELRGAGMKNLQPNFRAVDGAAVPHHTFYVLGTYIGRAGDGPTLENEGAKKVARLMDNCRISWGTVKEVGRRELLVRYEPLAVGETGLALGAPEEKRVRFDADVEPFSRVKPGDVVSVHWNYACELLSQRQTRNITKYTSMDIALANRLLARAGRRK